MKFRVKVKGECEVEANGEDEAIENALIYIADDIQGNLDVEEVISEEMEAKADLYRKYELDADAERQENFCN